MPSVAYADSFGEGGATGTLGYYLASAFEQIYVQQNGLVSFTGMLYCFCLLYTGISIQASPEQHAYS